ncbi:MAG TPA: lysophospholipid acyltransferase family protein [Geminicoccaceae bacterium]|nr:lysophospholipid acyltransferase family protein [Geminicoccaceae bacterium]
MSPRPKKRLLQRPRVRAVLARLAAGYLRLLHRTGRWRAEGDPEATALIRDGVPSIGAFWHGRLVMAPWVWRAMLVEAGRDPGTKGHVLASAHGDARLIAEAIERLGHGSVAGSSRRGGAGALLELRRILAEGGFVCLTPDGPLGPRMRAQPGVVQLARVTGAPVIPMAFAASNQRLLGSWDRLALPLPFARGVLAWGAPLRVPADADDEALERARRLLEDRLTALTAAADRSLGHAPVEPAPARA